MKTWRGRDIPFLVSTLLCFLALMGCAGLGKRLESPHVSLADIQIQEIKTFEAVARVELRVLNTNDVSLEIEGIDCTVQLNNREFGTGVVNTKTTVPPRNTAVVPMTLYSSLIDVGRGILDSRNDRKLTYKIKGRLHLGGGMLLPRVLPFTSEGELFLGSSG
ncbi:MAG TPA: LEA type 2 family protein [Syntrophobacteria bacterium]|nr:LEA type 2 family protein [Syntrophobacteria bacterium]